MASLEDLKGGGHRLPNPSAPVPAASHQPDRGVEGLQRLEFLIEQDQLPAYLRVSTEPPSAVHAKHPPTPWAQQARKEWPAVSANLSLPQGTWAGWTTSGVVHQVGPHFLYFDLLALWRTLHLGP